ncbi:unnamed protein product [Pleuronectes platessa]|uniref:Uncharacterized protein n=1 Tax=Pleuronectes platessa TaxID=8262 RepID=A0A9N7U616_PLEPL|nr:unnamed protein product [Pleuronectes platessa]
MTKDQPSLHLNVYTAPAEAHRQRGPPRERRVPPTGAVAEVIREKGPTRVQSRRRRPPYPVPSNGLPSAPAGDTAVKEKESPRTTDAVRQRRRGPPPKKNVEACRTPGVRRRGEEGDGATAPPAAARAQRFNHKYQ